MDHIIFFLKSPFACLYHNNDSCFKKFYIIFLLSIPILLELILDILGFSKDVIIYFIIRFITILILFFFCLILYNIRNPKGMKGIVYDYIIVIYLIISLIFEIISLIFLIINYNDIERLIN